MGGKGLWGRVFYPRAPFLTTLNASLDPVFVTCCTTGPDAQQDGVYFIQATTYVSGEGPKHLIEPTFLSPYRHEAMPVNSPKLLSSIGLTPEKLSKLSFFGDVISDLLQKLEARPVIVATPQQQFAELYAAYCPAVVAPRIVALESLSLFLHPRRGQHDFAASLHHFCGRHPSKLPSSDDARDLCEAMVRDHYARDHKLRQLIARCFDDVYREAGNEPSPLNQWLEIIESLLDEPSQYTGSGNADLFGDALSDGEFSGDCEIAATDSERILNTITPMFKRSYHQTYDGKDILSSRYEDAAPDPATRNILLQQFFDRLSKHFDAEPRAGQLELSQQVAEAFDNGNFLIGDAPTGTGKTLAYLAPLLWWAKQAETRVAVSTYTRALQEQAFFNEVPRAVELLKECGLTDEQLPRISLLKGRNNYICGRAIIDTAPEPSAASSIARITWMRLAIFYCEDIAADLDGFPVSPGVPSANAPATLRQARAMINQTRALPACCRGKSAMRCAAGIRTQQALRSHIVVTNHAFILAQPDEFSHVVFDECDHLHEVALSARSFDIELEEVMQLSKDLRRNRGRDRAALPMLSKLINNLPVVPPRLGQAAEDAQELCSKLDAVAFETSSELKTFNEYRRELEGKRTRTESASLFHEYLESGRGDELLTTLQSFLDTVNGLDSALRTTIEELGDIELRLARKIRWRLHRPLESLDHWREGLELWLGGESGEADFSDKLHFEAEFARRRHPLLLLKYLLPQEWLGDVYFPSLQSAALVSATSKIRDSFKPMRGYLGLDILAEDKQERAGRIVEEFSGPTTFSTDAAIYCVPEDAVPYAYRGPDHDAWLEYIENYFFYLGERTRGRVLGLFTNSALVKRIGERLSPKFRAIGLQLLWQGMPGLSKEEVMRTFKANHESILLGVDTFWYGVDFPGTTCEHIVIAKLPYGAPDRYMYAQQARLGYGIQRNTIYLPKALAMFRQGCGRLLRSEDDRGSITILDKRVLDGQHANFLDELPGGIDEWDKPNIVRASTDECLQHIFKHMGLKADVERRGLGSSFI